MLSSSITFLSRVLTVPVGADRVPSAHGARPEQSHLFPGWCSPNGTDNRRQRQRRTKRPPQNPAAFLSDFRLYKYLLPTKDAIPQEGVSILLPFLTY